LAALAYLITCFGIRFPNLLKWRWLSYLGQHSLQVFTFHLVLLYAIIPLYNNLIIPAGWAWIITADMVILSTLTLPAWLHVRYREFMGRNGSVANT
jgi:peptidoglycan/LPS O-acetylase OafA/YrhL